MKLEVLNQTNLKENAHSLYQIRSWLFGLKLAVWIAIMGIGILLVSMGGFLPVALGVLVLGAMFTHGVELQHQNIHNTGFRNRNLNALSGFILGIPMLVSFEHYKLRHLRHHRNAGTREDSEFFQKDDLNCLTISGLSARAFNPKRLRLVIQNILRAWQRGVVDESLSARCQSRLRRDYRWISVIAATFIAISVAIGAWIAPVIWLLAVVLVAEPLHFIIELPEHLGCDVDNSNPRVNTRTIKGSKFSFWLTNGNNYHVEHHLRPNIPIDRLPAVHKEIRSSIHHFELNYLNFFRRVLKGEVCDV